MRPLDSSKVAVLCAISSFGIIGPYFFEDETERAVSVTGPHYAHMLENVLDPEPACHPGLCTMVRLYLERFGFCTVCPMPVSQ